MLMSLTFEFPKKCLKTDYRIENTLLKVVEKRVLAFWGSYKFKKVTNFNLRELQVCIN